jgi:hypothetical protein
VALASSNETIHKLLVQEFWHPPSKIYRLALASVTNKCDEQSDMNWQQDCTMMVQLHTSHQQCSRQHDGMLKIHQLQGHCFIRQVLAHWSQ